MGYGYYVLSDGREAGYGFAADCDKPGCTARIDRGLGYLCGDSPEGWQQAGSWGCRFYFCGAHGADHDCPNPNDFNPESHVFAADPQTPEWCFNCGDGIGAHQ